MRFKDYFSDRSEDYNQYRPHYPKELFTYLASVSPALIRAWDCATGNGQAAVQLTDYFLEVIATDASQAQIDCAVTNDAVTYSVVAAEESHIRTASIDLITVAQAFHWFDREKFSKEVDRVLREDGVLAIWTYNLLSVKPTVNDIINHLYETVLGDYWDFERGMVEDGYQNVQLPFNELQAPVFQMTAQWNLSQLIGYLLTWSAVKKYHQETDVNPLETTAEQLAIVWGEPARKREVSWPLSLRLWQKI